MQPVGSGRLEMAKRLFSSIVLLALLCTAHSAFAATRICTDDDKDGTVQVNLGDTVEVHLKSNPASGYEWFVHPKSTALLHLLAETSMQPTEPDADRPAVQVFKFEIRRKGDGILLMRYAPARQKPYLGEEQFTLHVVVN